MRNGEAVTFAEMVPLPSQGKSSSGANGIRTRVFKQSAGVNASRFGSRRPRHNIAQWLMCICTRLWKLVVQSARRFQATRRTIGVQRPLPTGQTGCFGPLIEATGTDAAGIKRVPDVTAVAHPAVMRSGRPSAFRAAYKRSTVAEAGVLLLLDVRRERLGHSRTIIGRRRQARISPPV